MPDTPAMKPSTYQQVRENMTKLFELLGDGSDIENLSELVAKVNDLATKVDNLINQGGGSGGGAGGDITVDPDTGSMTVNGITVITNFVDVDTTPGSYTRDVTFELKQCSSIGLGSNSAFTGMNHCIVVTFKHTLVEGESVDTYQFKPQQIAYGNNAVMYSRTASDATSSATWGGWMAVIPEIPEQQKQIIQSDTEPENQAVGDYWCEPLS